MEFKEPSGKADFQTYVESNDPPYGKCAADYARAWADEIEARMERGESLTDCADPASHDVEKRPGFGITGFVYGVAVSMLAQTWKHGDELRRWHNPENADRHRR